MHNKWKLLDNDKLVLKPSPIPTSTPNWNVIRRSSSTDLKSLFALLFPIEFWDELALLVSNNMICKVTSKDVSKTRAKYYRPVTSSLLMKWYTMTLLLENKYSSASSHIDNQLRKRTKKLKKKGAKLLPLGIHRYHAIMSCFFGDDQEMQELFAKLRGAWQNCFTPDDKGVCDEIVYEYHPRKATKKKHEMNGDAIPVTYIPRKPHPNGLLNYKLAFKTAQGRPYVVDFEPYLISVGYSPIDAMAKMIDRWPYQHRLHLICDSAFDNVEVLKKVTGTFSVKESTM